MKEFKLIVAGGRDYNDYAQLEGKLIQLANTDLLAYEVSIVCGMARGADALGFKFAKENQVQLYPYHADWNKHGKAAGFRRNVDMGNDADGLLAFWDGKSSGTKHMIDYMQRLQKDVWVFNY